MTEHAHVIQITTFTARDGRFEDLTQATRPFVQLATDADGCFGAQLCTIAEAPDVVAIVSRWRDKAALDEFTGRHADAGQPADELVASGPTNLHYTALRD